MTLAPAKSDRSSELQGKQRNNWKANRVVTSRSLICVVFIPGGVTPAPASPKWPLEPSVTPPCAMVVDPANAKTGGVVASLPAEIDRSGSDDATFPIDPLPIILGFCSM